MIKGKFSLPSLCLLLACYIIYDRLRWASISNWFVDEGATLWIGKYIDISDYSIGIMSGSNLGLPNMNGMLYLGKFLSFFPGLFSASFIFSITFVCLVFYLSLVLSERNLKNFFLLFLSIVFCLTFSSSTIQLSNNFILILVNLLFFIFLYSYLQKQNSTRFFLLFYPIILAPIIYLAGIVNSFSFFICILIAVYFRPINFSFKEWILPALIFIIFFLIVLFYSFIPFIEYIHNLDVTIYDHSFYDRLKLALFSIFKFPSFITYDAANIYSSFPHNGSVAKDAAHWNLKNISEPWSKYLFENGILEKKYSILLLVSLLVFFFQSIFFLLICSFFLLFKIKNIKNIKNIFFINEKNTQIIFILTVFIFVFISYVTGTLLGAEWIEEKRYDQLIQFLPLLIILFYLSPLLISTNNKIKKIINLTTYSSATIFVFLNIFVGIFIIDQYKKYVGPLLTESDVPLIYKERIVDLIAEDSNFNKGVKVQYYFNVGPWKSFDQYAKEYYGEKYPYKNIFNYGIEYKYLLVSKYKIGEFKNEDPVTNYKSADYIVAYKSHPPKIEKKYIEKVKIENRLILIKIKKK